MNDDYLIIRNVRKKVGKQRILKGVSLSLPKKGLVGILGPSGCGKTTLLNILSGVDPDFVGSIVMLGQSISHLSEDEKSAFRLKNVGYIHQNYSLLEREDAYGNIVIPLRAVYQDENAAIEKKIGDLLRFVGLEGKIHQRIDSMSGGEKQRVAIARALVNDPSIILADEPTGALDGAASKLVFSLLRNVSRKKLVIVVSHDEESLLKYSDRLVRMKNGEIVSDETIENAEPGEAPSSLRLAYTKPKPKVPTSVLLQHAKSVLRARRLRSILCTSFVSLGHLGLGLSFYIYFSIESQVSGALSSFVKPNSIVVEPLAPFSPATNVEACEFSRAKAMAAVYSESVTDCGVTLLTDYEATFCDEDAFFIQRNGKANYPLDMFSARSINDFLWIDETTEVYPSIPTRMDTLDVVLGLPEAEMSKLCLELNVQRDFKSLGSHLSANKVTMLVYLSNVGAEFENDDMVDVVGVVPSPVPCLYHTDPMWNMHYFVDHLKFRPTITGDLSNMQEMLCVPYLSHKGNLHSLWGKIKKEESYGDLILEPFNASYLPTLNDEANPISLPRVYLYSGQKHGISEKNIRDLQGFCKKIKGVLPISERGYYASCTSLLSGFSGRFFLCKDKDDAFSIGEHCSVMKVDEADLPFALPDGVVSGGVADGNNAFWLEIGNGDDFSGRSPSKPSEVCLSSSLYEKWGKPSSVYVAAEIDSERYTQTVLRTFSYAKLDVVGVATSNKDTLYVSSEWTFDFFLSELGCSGFDLETKGLVLDFASEKDAMESLPSLSEAFPSFAFFHPSDEVRSTVKETTNYIGAVLIAFSGLSLLMAAVLLLVVISITIEEQCTENGILFRMGISRDDRRKSLRMFLLVYLLRSLLPSILSLLALEVFIHVFISKYFGSQIGFPLSWPPLFAMIAASVIFYFLFAIYISRRKEI